MSNYKIQQDHLNRAGYIYVRQSSLAQVEQNLESQRRQYALAERAKDLGWQDIRVIDEALGAQAAGALSAGVSRHFFPRSVRAGPVQSSPLRHPGLPGMATIGTGF